MSEFNSGGSSSSGSNGSSGAGSSGSSNNAPSSSSTSSAPAPGKGLDSAIGAFGKSSANSNPGQSGSDPNANAPAPKESTAPVVPPRFKVPVNGREVEVDVEEMKRKYSLAQGAHEKFEQAARMRQQAEQAIGRIKDSEGFWETALQIHGPQKTREMAERWLASQLEAEMLSPQERKVREQERIIREYEAKEQRTRQESEQKQLLELQQHWRGEYEKKITDALQKSGLPKTERTVQRMAHYMSLSHKNKMDLQPEHVVEMVREDYVSDVRSLFHESDGETLLKILGDDVANKIRKADLARIRSKGAPAMPSSAQTDTARTQTSPTKDREVLGVDDFRERIKRRLG